MLLKEKLASKNLILASGSPRRREILAGSGLPFTLAEPYQVREVWPKELPAESVAEYLANLKSEAYSFPLAPEDILLTADTTVVLGEKILGKPSCRKQAIEMLRELSGREHKVFTGVVLRSAEKCDGFNAASTVWFRKLRPEEIEYYVDTFSPMDKAGAYGIQEWIGYVGIERIEGSYYNVMGMPIQMIYAKLEEYL